MSTLPIKCGGMGGMMEAMGGMGAMVNMNFTQTNQMNRS